jgi:hypothetical protein
MRFYLFSVLERSNIWEGCQSPNMKMHMKPHVCMLAHVLLMCSELTICGHLNPFYADVCKVKATLGYTYLVHIVSSCMDFGLYFAFVDHSLILV